MEEKNIISEEDLEKAAGGVGITKDQLKKALSYLKIAGVSVAGGIAVGASTVAAVTVAQEAGLAAGNYISNKKKGEKQ